MIFRVALAELRKARFKKRFWVLFIVMGVLVPLLQVLAAYFITRSVDGSSLDSGGNVSSAIAQNAATAFSLTRNFLGAALPFFILPIAAITGSFLIGEERGFKMWKVILVAQPNRPGVLGGKFLAGVTLLSILILASAVSSAVIGFLANLIFFQVPLQGDWGTLLPLLLLQCLVTAAPLALSMLLSSLIASPAMSLIGTVLLPSILEGIALLSISSQLNQVTPLNAPFQALKIQNLIQEIPRYFLTRNLNLGSGFAGSSASGGLFGGSGGFGGGGRNNPFNNLVSFSWSEIGWSVMVSAVYAAAFALLFWLAWRRRDVLD